MDGAADRCERGGGSGGGLLVLHRGVHREGQSGERPALPPALPILPRPCIQPLSDCNFSFKEPNLFINAENINSLEAESPPEIGVFLIFLVIS